MRDAACADRDGVLGEVMGVDIIDNVRVYEECRVRGKMDERMNPHFCVYLMLGCYSCQRLTPLLRLKKTDLPGQEESHLTLK